MTESERQLEALIDLERARTLEHELRIESEALLSGLNTLSKAENPQQMLSELIEVLRSVFEFENAFILSGIPGNTLDVIASTDESFIDTHWTPGKFFQRVIKGEPIAAFNILEINEWNILSTEMTKFAKSALHVPLSQHQQVAILICIHSKPHFFGPKHVKIAKRFAPLTTQAFININLKRSVAERDRLFTLSLDMMGITTFDGIFIQLNSAWEKCLGYSESELCEKAITKFVVFEDRRIILKAFRDLTLGIENEVFEIRCLTKSGELKWLLCSAGICKTQRLCYVVARDITNQKMIQNKLAYEAEHDSLTGLVNRKSVMKKLTQALKNFKSNNKQHFAVLFLDLDRFKIVNDSLGHLIGDELLKEIASRLNDTVGLNNTVARLGGDEFLILLENIDKLTDALEIASRVQQMLKTPIRLSGYNIVSTASIGITSSALNYDVAADALRDADIAMYLSKSQGGASYSVFDQDMHTKAIIKLQFETDLHSAISNNQLKLYYQPIFNLRTGEISGFEALLRWQHPSKGLLSAEHFIPIAEESDLISDMGQWALEQCCKDLKKWEKSHNLSDTMYISINLSSKQFWQKELLSNIKQIVNKYKLSPSCLKFEITESLFMDDSTDSIRILESIKNYGISLFVDDFGTGYSSLSYLQRFPFDVLKIDKSFVNQMETDRASLDLVRTIILLARSLDLQVIAEGIESIEQRDLLIELDCHYGQGYILGTPLCSEEVLMSLSSNQLEIEVNTSDVH